jgi:hypothetical protein
MRAEPGFFENAAAVVPSDTASDNFAPSAITVGGAGTVVLTLANGNTVTYTAVAGQTLPAKGVRVGTASTATAMVRSF